VSSADRVFIADVPVDTFPMDELLSRLIEAAAERTFFQVSTINLDFLLHSHQDEEVREIFRTNALNIPDGAPVAWAGRVLGHESMCRVAGADLVPALAAAAAQEGLRVFLLGGQSGAAADAAARLSEANPGLNIAFYEPPVRSLDDTDDDEIIERIDAAQPNILFVAFGHPKQDKWIHRNRHRLPMVAIGVGCSLDLIAGRQRRAPALLQRVGLEWAYRVAREPRRLARRYARDGLWMVRVLVPLVLVQAARSGAVAGEASPRPEPFSWPTS